MSEQQQLVVLDHHRDDREGVYRLTVGFISEHEQPLYEDDGITPQRGVSEVTVVPQIKTGENGEPVLDDNNQLVYEEVPVEQPGEVMTETVRTAMPVEDFVFAVDDERWADREPDEIAAVQRAIVRDALTAREEVAGEEAAARAAAQSAMPGVGEAL